jgi:hypothetical protein
MKKNHLLVQQDKKISSNTMQTLKLAQIREALLSAGCVCAGSGGLSSPIDQS